MTYTNLVEFDCVLPRLKANSHKQLFRKLAEEAARHLGANENALYKALLEQEQTGGCAIGQGAAMAQLQLAGIHKPYRVLATLAHEIEDFKFTADNQPVIIAALVISPQKDGPLHLRRLARAARLLKNEALQKRIVEAKDELSLRAILMDPDGWMLAA